MKILDRYILKKLYVTFFFCMLLFTVIAVAVDSSEKTDDFVASGLSTSEIIKQYYLGFIPHIWGLLYPLFVFIAVIFVTSKMAARSEIVSILASGTSFNRFLLPYIIGGISLALLLLWANTQVIPKANGIRVDFENKYINHSGPNNDNSGCFNCFYLKSDSVTYVSFKQFDATRKYATQFSLEKVKNAKVVYNLRADNMRWDTAKNTWRLERVVRREVLPMGEKVSRVDTEYIKLNFKPEELVKDDFAKDKMTSAKLSTFIGREELRGKEGLNTLRVELYRRLATPFTVLLLTFIGAVIASRKTRGGSGLHLALGITIAALFIVSDRFSTVFSTKGNLPPALAVWLPNIVFCGVAWLLYRKAPK